MPLLNPNIAIGAQNADVQRLQTTLRQLGHPIAESEVNQQWYLIDRDIRLEANL